MRSGSISGAASSTPLREWIDDYQAANALTGLKILRQQPVTPGFERRSHNERIVEAEAMRSSDGKGLDMGRDIDGANGVECGSHIRDRVRDDFPLEAELATEDGSELVQNLHTDHATRENRLPRHLTLVLPALGVDQNVRVE